MAQIQILASALVSSVISGMSPNLLVPQFLTYKMNSHHHSHLTTTTAYVPEAAGSVDLVIMENSPYSILSLAWDARL